MQDDYLRFVVLEPAGVAALIFDPRTQMGPFANAALATPRARPDAAHASQEAGEHQRHPTGRTAFIFRSIAGFCPWENLLLARTASGHAVVRKFILKNSFEHAVHSQDAIN
ncbi:hypothetical protein [Polaromonas sp.]|uniref:hypothetical protein n=1 Tax=Polaromonas sp. TaxID=1869339 RepID=UPI0013BBD69F|nr:hypothetical protein [Polaromonas sp.]NDP63328.1 hypothetical protein [Polaromonas sp.]